MGRKKNHKKNSADFVAEPNESVEEVIEPNEIVAEPNEIVAEVIEPNEIVSEVIEPNEIVSEPNEVVADLLAEPNEVDAEPNEVDAEPNEVVAEVVEPNEIVLPEKDQSDCDERMVEINLSSPVKLEEDIREVRKYIIEEEENRRSTKMFLCAIS